MENVHSELTGRIVTSAIEVHRALGPGLLERTYRACLQHQLAVDGLAVQEEVPVPIVYHGIEVESAFRADFVVEGKVIVELKAVERLLAVHDTQLLTYLKLTGLPVGLLVNFNVVRLQTGIHRFANTRPRHPVPA